MSYQSVRTALVDAAYDWQRREFMSAFDPAAPTVIIVPGGMGSQLDRTVKVYRDGGDLPFGDFATVWAGFGLLFGGEADSLRMNAAGEDFKRRIVVPNGPIRWKPIYSPYDQAKRYFRDAGFNCFIFGYDWRRSVLENAAYLDAFLRSLAREADALRGNAEGLPRTTLLAHSLGGVVVATYLHRFRARGGETLDRYCERVVTVGTPFYGAACHSQRYFIGDSLLNWIQGRRGVASAVASMPGPYILCHLDREAYEAMRGTVLEAECPAYPVQDDAGAPVDVFDGAFTWPSWMGGAWRATIRGYLDDAMDVRALLTSPLPGPAGERMFHLRAGRTETARGLAWKGWPRDGKSELESVSPFDLVQGDLGAGRAGDGVVPWWSSRLAHTPASQVYALQQASVHMDFFEHPEVLAASRRIIDDHAAPTFAQVQATMAGIAANPTPRATRAEAEAFVQQAEAISPGDARASDPAMWKRVLEAFVTC